MSWDPPIETDIVPIHAALVPSSPTGEIVFFEGFFGGRQGQSYSFRCAPAPGEDQIYRLDDVEGPLENEDGEIEMVRRNLFCAGHAQLADGRWLVVGGSYVGASTIAAHDHPHGGSGIRDTWAYSPRAGEWQRMEYMNPQPGSDLRGGGRWYPTCVTLGNGHVLAFGGHPVGSDEDMADDFPAPGARRHNNNIPEVYNPGLNRWTELRNADNEQNLALDEYNRLHVTPTGHVFFSTVTKRHGDTRLYDPYTGKFSGSGYGTHSDARYDDANCAAVTSSVMLPLLPSDPGNVWILVAGSTAPERLNLAAQSPSWISAGDRQTFPGNESPMVRLNLHGIILPTGQVFFAFGVRPDRSAVNAPEIYTPAIDWSNRRYETDDNGVALPGTWQTLSAAGDQSDRRRGYHSVAVLQPDGSVWAGGSTHNLSDDDITNPGAATDERSIEIFRPSYGNNRPTIVSAPETVGYGDSFNITMSTTGQMHRVVLVRCGSFTHAFDSDQRYISLNFTRQGATITATAPASANIAPPGYYLLYVLRNENTPSVRGHFIRIAHQDHYPVLQQSTYSLLEVRALTQPFTNETEAVFGEAIDLIWEGFLPHELNVPADGPNIAWRFTTGAPDVPGMRIEPRYQDFEVNPSTNPDRAQRFRYVYDVVFENQNAFDTFDDDQVRFVEVRATLGGRTISVNLTLMKRANPYMRDGDPAWLSTDLRIHKATVGDVNTAGGPQSYIDGLLDAFENHPAADDSDAHPFEALDASQDDNPVVLAVPQDDNGIYNFAVARVRFLSVPNENADNVKVFFRMFNTVGTALEYNPNGTYNTLDGPGGRIPGLGKQAFHITSIPFFAAPRVTPDLAMDEQQDNLVNRKTLFGAGPDMVYRYYGCWLDVNTLAEHFPKFPKDDGPFGEGGFIDDLIEGGGPKSMLSHISGYHQCLVAEIQFDDDPVNPGDTPFTSDNLAQRNLATVPVANPGLEDITRTAQTSFDVKPSDVPTEILTATATPATVSTSRRLRADELVFRRNDLPHGTMVELYLPDVDIEDVLALSSLRNGPPTLKKVDDRTIRFELGEVTYVALPGGRELNIAGLMSVTLPKGIVAGQIYTLPVKQYSGRTLRWVGAFNLRIPVDHGPNLLPGETEKLSILRYIFETMPEKDRWYPVFERYLYEIGERVRGFGGDPDGVDPSPHGTGNRTPDCPTGGEDDDPCCDPDGDPTADEEVKCINGRICQLEYDCFGSFDAFVLKDCDCNYLRVCEAQDTESLARYAWRERVDVTLHYKAKNPSGAVNTTCPWSGKPVVAGATAEFEGRTVGFCCKSHRDRFVRTLTVGTDTADPLSKAQAQVYCPWSNRPVQRDAIVTLPTGSVGFCSRAHHDRYKYAVNYYSEIISRLDADGNPPPQIRPRQVGGGHVHDHEQTTGAKQTRAEPPKSINKTCPWTKRPVSNKALTEFLGYSVGFAKPEDRDRFQEASRLAGAYTPRIEQDNTRHDHRRKAINTTCPCGDRPVKSGVTAQVGERHVGFCSETHRDEHVKAVKHFRASCPDEKMLRDVCLVRLNLKC
jgi:galactose oxidase-like protein